MNFARHRLIPADRIPPMPLSLKGVGRYHASAGWEENNDGIYRPHCGIFWCRSGNAAFVIGNRKYTLEAEQAVYYYPFEAHKIYGISRSFDYFWMTFDGIDAAGVLGMFQYPREPFHAGPPPEEMFRRAYESLEGLTDAARYLGGALVYRILSLAGSPADMQKEKSKETHLVIRFKQIVAEEAGNRELNLMNIAERLQCHRTTLTRLVKKELGIVPAQYLNHVRLQNALELLENSNLTAAEIGEICGFATPEYFSRKFKQLTGEPPRRFRNH